jgi:taurine dioxygenase
MAINQTYRHIEVLPLGDAAGADVRCGPLQGIDDETFVEIHRAWLEHLVLRFRDQRLDDRELAEFGRRFGPLKSAAVGGGSRASTGEGENPDIHVVSNVLEGGTPIGILGDGDVIWHSDMAGFAVPPTASVLHALEVPPRGGDTVFNNMYLAYDVLPDDLKRRLLDLTIKHRVQSGSAGAGTGARHPVVSTHPETECNALFLGAPSNTSIPELPAERSAELLAVLWAYATEGRFGWRQQWRDGDVVVWDNRCLIHRRDAFEPSSRRVLLRIQVEGSSPPSAAKDALERAPHPRGVGVLG